MTYDQAQALMPKGWVLWGNHGDGKWRAGTDNKENRIIPANSIEQAVERATIAAKGIDGLRPGSSEWWAALRRIKAEWR